MKTSMNTFLNAMTYPDKTIHPVSSRDEQDFHNLMRVYLDAVFHPLLLGNPTIFAQEGRHYETAPDGNVTCKGVVFNEKKGVFSSPDALLDYEANRRLFPDTCYHWVSGGDPEHIPERSWEEFTQAHRQWYHASNALIFLDGTLDLDAALEFLDKALPASCAAARFLACYRAIPDFLQNFTGDVSGAILGAVAENDPLRTPWDKGKSADAYYWKKLSYESLCRARQEMLATTTRDVSEYAARMQDFAGHSALCVLGPRSQPDACGAQLDRICSL